MWIVKSEYSWQHKKQIYDRIKSLYLTNNCGQKYVKKLLSVLWHSFSTSDIQGELSARIQVTHQYNNKIKVTYQYNNKQQVTHQTSDKIRVKHQYNHLLVKCFFALCSFVSCNNCWVSDHVFSIGISCAGKPLAYCILLF